MEELYNYCIHSEHIVAEYCITLQYSTLVYSTVLYSIVHNSTVHYTTATLTLLVAQYTLVLHSAHHLAVAVAQTLHHHLHGSVIQQHSGTHTDGLLQLLVGHPDLIRGLAGAHTGVVGQSNLYIYNTIKYNI